MTAFRMVHSALQDPNIKGNLFFVGQSIPTNITLELENKFGHEKFEMCW